MSEDIITLPVIGTLTSTEVHSGVIGFVMFFYIGVSRAKSQLRREPWYFLGLSLVGLVAGVLVGDRRE